MYEHRGQAPLSNRRFMVRMARHAAFGAALVAGSLGLGMLGYHHFAQQTWTDAFLNSAMLLGGMGPVGTLDTESGKLFAGFFALYAGMVFLVLIATLITPIFHRIMHRFHWDADRLRASGGRRTAE